MLKWGRTSTQEQTVTSEATITDNDHSDKWNPTIATKTMLMPITRQIWQKLEHGNQQQHLLLMMMDQE